ncbi:MAG: sigma-70 family RNA polymerase sigma factor [Phycisphaerae bacterium]|nr:sigma-70 family RNA polymerase sigma factor [Phycisphaerae bacterium]
MTSPEDEITLVERARQGDRTALKILLLRIRDRLKLHVSNRMPPDLASTTEPDDIIHETWLKVFRRIASFEPRGPGSLYAWTRTIAENVLKNAAEAERADKRGGNRRVSQAYAAGTDSCPGLLDGTAGKEHTPTWTLRRREADLWAKAAVGRLPDHYRRAVTLVDIEGESRKDAAAKMEITKRALDGLLRRGREMLRDELGSPLRFLSSGG